MRSRARVTQAVMAMMALRWAAVTSTLVNVPILPMPELPKAYW